MEILVNAPKWHRLVLAVEMQVRRKARNAFKSHMEAGDAGGAT